MPFSMDNATLSREAGSIVQSEGHIDWTLREKLETFLVNDLVDNLPQALRLDRHTVLWNGCFKNILDALIGDADKKASVLLEFSAYAVFALERLCTRLLAKYGSRFPSLSNMFTWNCAIGFSASDYSNNPTYEQMVCILQFVALHVGDICRYNKSFASAEDSYLLALRLDRKNGHPLNQLGLLATVKRDTLAAVYYYNRALLSQVPFHNAAINLARFYDCFPEELGADWQSKFVRFQATLYSGTYKPWLQEMASDSFNCFSFRTLDEVILLRMFVVSLGTLEKIKVTNFDAGCRLILTFLQQLLMHSLQMANSGKLLDLLYVFCRWIQFDYMEFLTTENLFKWNDVLELLNHLPDDESEVERIVDTNTPTKVDVDLHGFKPLKFNHAALDFDHPDVQSNDRLRMRRIFAFKNFLLFHKANPLLHASERNAHCKVELSETKKMSKLSSCYGGFRPIVNARKNVVSLSSKVPSSPAVPSQLRSAPSPPDLDYSTMMKLFSNLNTNGGRSFPENDQPTTSMTSSVPSMVLNNFCDPSSSFHVPNSETMNGATDEWPKNVSDGAVLLKALQQAAERSHLRRDFVDGKS